MHQLHNGLQTPIAKQELPLNMDDKDPSAAAEDDETTTCPIPQTVLKYHQLTCLILLYSRITSLFSILSLF